MYELIEKAVEYAREGYPSQAYQCMNEAFTVYEETPYDYDSFRQDVLRAKCARLVANLI